MPTSFLLKATSRPKAIRQNAKAGNQFCDFAADVVSDNSALTLLNCDLQKMYMRGIFAKSGVLNSYQNYFADCMDFQIDAQGANLHVDDCDFEGRSMGSIVSSENGESQTIKVDYNRFKFEETDHPHLWHINIERPRAAASAVSHVIVEDNEMHFNSPNQGFSSAGIVISTVPTTEASDLATFQRNMVDMTMPFGFSGQLYTGMALLHE